MNLKSLVRLFSKISLVFVFVVIIAGSIVRVTGSGMGCPDWPRCFGYNIPPTDIGPLTFSANHTFGKKQMIIRNDTLWVANDDFISGAVFDHANWHKYPKHDYATFNPLQTWIEYINRLATILFGIPVSVLFVLSIFYWIKKKDVKTFLLAGFTMVMLAFEAWLGKLVVDGNLKEHSISYHMIGSIAIVSLLLILVYRHRKNPSVALYPKGFKATAMMLLVIAFIQVMLGIQVREEVDVIAKNIDPRSEWIQNLSNMFIIHRSFSILVTIVALFLFVMNRRFTKPIPQVNAIILVLALEIFAGVVLSNFAMPKVIQPVHLLLGVVFFSCCFYTVLKATSPGRTV